MQKWSPPIVIEATIEGVALQWKAHDEDQPAHWLYHGDVWVGEAYGVDGRECGSTGRWHSKITDNRSLAPTVDDAKQELVRDYLAYIAQK